MTFVQRFTNISEAPISEAHYSFPLYDGSAITSLRYYIGDAKVLEDRVRPKQEAKEEYRRAIEHMETAALVTEYTPKVFETLLDNIPAKANIKIVISYINRLKADTGGEDVFVTIPTSVAPRYGIPLWGYSGAASSNVTEAGFTII